MSTETPSRTLRDRLSDVRDPRIHRTRRHELIDVLFITICAVIAGAEDFVTIADFGRAKREWFSQRLDLPNGIPSHDTFARVFARLDPAALNTVVMEWIDSIKHQVAARLVNTDLHTDENQIALDGKTLRHSFDNANGKSAIHMVSAWSSRARLVLGQVKVDAKSNEITAIPHLLSLLDITGCLITIDAMGCQKAIATQIHDQGADYVLALKENQPNLARDAKLFIEHAESQKYEDVVKRTYTTLEKDHGRIDTRRYLLVGLPEGIAWQDERRDWPGLQSIGIVESTRRIGDNTTTDTRYYITSIPVRQKGSARRFGQAVRGHWGIENSLHWTLDVAFNEDACRVRKENAPENLAIIRHIALNILKQDVSAKIGVKSRRLRAGWSNEYLEHLLTI
jgi:predicted transposase YbfD/YdcC